MEAQLTTLLPGSILLCGVAIAVSAFLLWRSNKKQAAVGRRYVVAITNVCLPRSIR
jgi:hypothetical protein